jgi:arylsulfatase A-like enzyme
MEVPSADPYADRDWPAPDRNFAAMVHRLDRDVGKLLDALQQAGKENETLILFTSDNGPHREGGHDPDFFDDNGPLRGIKRDLYEGGIRVPFLARWKGTIRPGITNHVCAFWDFLPTAADLAGARTPDGLDGISFAPTLFGGSGQKKHDYLYWEFHERGFKQAIRTGEWKAVRLAPRLPIELYDLRIDPGETRNVAGANPEIVQRITGLFRNARTDSPEWPVKG